MKPNETKTINLDLKAELVVNMKSLQVLHFCIIQMNLKRG